MRLTASSRSQSKRPIARALRVFSSGDNLPIIVHCSQGRDRTGIIIALLLRALGTDEHAVALDYAETDVRLQVGCELCRQCSDAHVAPAHLVQAGVSSALSPK